MTDIIAEQVTEFGYRTPDGVEHFNDFSPNVYVVGDLSTHAGQKATQDRFKKHLKNSGLPENWGKLEFIQRVRTTTYSDVIPLVPCHKDDDLSELAQGF